MNMYRWDAFHSEWGWHLCKVAANLDPAASPTCDKTHSASSSVFPGNLILMSFKALNVLFIVSSSLSLAAAVANASSLRKNNQIKVHKRSWLLWFLLEYTPTQHFSVFSKFLCLQALWNRNLTWCMQGLPWCDRSFSSDAPHIWNSLPLNLRSCLCITKFESLLKSDFTSQVFKS